MTTQELLDKGAIFFEKLKDGLDTYQEVKMTMDAKRALAHFKSLKKEYGADNAFVDFYYFRLDEDSREMVDEILTMDELQYLQLIAPIDEDIYDEIVFPLNDKLLPIVVKLNAEEMLFSTIYFLEGKNGRARTTWWGNYENEYLCFKDK